MRPLKRGTIHSGAFALVFLITWAASPAAEAADRWTKLRTVPYTLNNKQDAIAFASAEDGWYGNGTGRLYGTRDGGNTWSLLWQRRGTYIRALGFSDERTGFLGNVGPGYFPNVTDKTALYMTRDGGKTWKPVKSGNGPVITGICAIDVLRVDGEVKAVRAGGHVGGPAMMMESFDNGASWSSRDMSAVTGMILDIRFLDEQTGFIAGATEADEGSAKARIIKTVDGGKTWRVVFESDRAGDNNWKLAFPSSRIGYATIISYDAPNDEPKGYVAKTEDGGESWSKMPVTSETAWIPYGITFLDENRGFVGGSTGGYETRNGGKTWMKTNMGLSVNKFSVTQRADGARAVIAIGAQVSRLLLSAPENR